MAPRETQANTLSPSTWSDIIQQWQCSALSGAEFCLQRDLVYHQFQYWKQKLSKTSTHSTTKNPSTFVQVASVPVSQEGITITLPGGIVIRGLNESNIGLVRRILEQF